MSSDLVFASDCRQSVSAAFVADVVKANQERLVTDPMVDQMPVPEAGLECPKDKKHGRMLMSLKDGMLECGVCSFKQAAPK